MIIPVNGLVSTMALRNITGYPSTDVGTLCSAGEGYVNKWAKYKPVRFNFSYNRPNNWWKALDGFCGLSIPTRQVSQMASVMSDIKAGVTWAYLPPRGGTEEPYRLLDFQGYNSKAYFPLFEPIIPEIVYSTANGLQVNTDWEAEADDTILNITDISDFSSYYFGALIKKVGTNSYVWKTSDNIISASEAISVDMSLVWAEYGYSYEVYCFLCSAKKAGIHEADPSGTIVPLPFSVKTFKLQASAYRVYVYAEQMAAGSSEVKFHVSVTNTGSSSGTFSNVTVSVLIMNREDDTVSYSNSKKITFTIGAGQTYELFGEATVDLIDKPGFTGADNLNRNFKMKFTSSNQYLNYGEFDIDMKKSAKNIK